MENITGHKLCVLISIQLLSEIFFSLKRIKLNVITIVHWSSCSVEIILSDFNEIWISISYFHKTISNFMKSIQLEPSFSVQTGGRTDKTKLTVAFRNFADASKMTYYLLYTFCTLNNWHKIVYNIWDNMNSKGYVRHSVFIHPECVGFKFLYTNMPQNSFRVA